MSEKSIKSDLARLDAMRDTDIDYSDSPELDESFFEKPTIQNKKNRLAGAAPRNL